MQSPGKQWVAIDVVGQVFQDGSVHLPISVRFVDGAAHVLEELRIADVLSTTFHGLDDGDVTRYLTQREQRVYPVIARCVRAYLLVMIELFQIPARQWTHAMIALMHHLVPVHLQDVPVAFVDQQAADGETRIVIQVAEVARVASRDQPLHRLLDAQCVHRALPVRRQRVIHVETDPLDVGHAQIAVYEDAVRSRYAHTIGGHLDQAGQWQTQLTRVRYRRVDGCIFRPLGVHES